MVYLPLTIALIFLHAWLSGDYSGSVYIILLMLGLYRLGKLEKRLKHSGDESKEDDNQ